MSETLTWTWSRLERLSPLDVYDLLALRSDVFVMEQECPFLDADGADIHSWHLLGRTSSGALIAYLRLVDAGVKFVEPSIGRVVSARSVRGQGIGIRLMQEGIARARQTWPAAAVRIGAQHRLERFYESLGFVSDGPIYLEDGIDHIEMVLPAPNVSIPQLQVFQS